MRDAPGGHGVCPPGGARAARDRVTTDLLGLEAEGAHGNLQLLGIDGAGTVSVEKVKRLADLLLLLLGEGHLVALGVLLPAGGGAAVVGLHTQRKPRTASVTAHALGSISAPHPSRLGRSPLCSTTARFRGIYAPVTHECQRGERERVRVRGRGAVDAATRPRADCRGGEVCPPAATRESSVSPRRDARVTTRESRRAHRGSLPLRADAGLSATAASRRTARASRNKDPPGRGRRGRRTLHADSGAEQARRAQDAHGRRGCKGVSRHSGEERVPYSVVMRDKWPAIPAIPVQTVQRRVNRRISILK